MPRGTSLSAHRSLTGAHSYRQRLFLFLLSRDRRGATLEEMEEALALPGNTVRPRRCELENVKLVEDSGVTRPTRSGRQAIVWVVPAATAATARRMLAAKGIEA